MGGYVKILITILFFLFHPSFVFSVELKPFDYPLYQKLVQTVRLGGSWSKYYGHLGEDYGADPGDTVYAVADGVVELVKNWPLCDKFEKVNGELKKVDSARGWGGVVIIKHDLKGEGNFFTKDLYLPNSPVEENPEVVFSQYGHLTNLTVTNGQVVKKGEKIGEIGKMCKWIPHLHIEIKDKNALENEILDGVGSGYSGKHDHAPHRYKILAFIEKNSYLSLSDDPQQKPASNNLASPIILSPFTNPQFLSNFWSSNKETAVFAEQSPFLLENVIEQMKKPKPDNDVPTKDAGEPKNNLEKPKEVVENGTYTATLVGSPKEVQVLKGTKTVELKLEAKNSGTVAWKKKDISVNVVGGKAKNSKYVTESWFTKLRPALLDQEQVSPGSIGTFTFVIAIPEDETSITLPFMIVRQDVQNNFYQVGNQQYIFQIKQVDSLPLVQNEEPAGTGGPTDIDDPNFFADIYNETKQVVKKTVKKTTDTVKDITYDTIDVIKNIPQYFSGGGGSSINEGQYEDDNSVDTGNENNNDIDIDANIESPTSTPKEDEQVEETEDEQVEEQISILEPDHTPYITNANPIIIAGERTSGVASVSLVGMDAEVEYPTSTGWLLRFNLSEGEQMIQVQGKNAAGAVVATTSVGYVFDVTPPDTPGVTITQTGTDPTYVSVSWISSDTLSGIMSYDVERKLMGNEANEWERVLTDTAETEYNFEAYLGDIYAIRVRARDRAYNISEWSGGEEGETYYVDYTKELVINEVNWMGTMNKATGGCRDHEWIELYNPTENPIDLTGWTVTIENKSGQMNTLTPTGSVSPRSYYLLARKASSRSAVIDLPIDHEYQNIVLPNDGARLTLRNSVGEIVDEVNFVDKWPAGTQTGGPSKNFYRSMERVSSYLPGSLTDNWRTNQHIPVLGRTNNCGELFGSPRQPNNGHWLLRAPDFYYADVFDASGTLTLSNRFSPYVLDIGTIIPAGKTLVLEPGVVVLGKGKESYLEVSGTLMVNGTAEAPVIFTSSRDRVNAGSVYWANIGEPTAGDWSRIQVVKGGMATVNNAKFYYGGYPDSKTLTVFNNLEAANVIRNIDSTLTITNSVFSNTYLPVTDQSYGAVVWTESTPGKTAETHITGSTFINGRYGYKQKGTGVVSSIKNSSFQQFVGPEGPIVLWNAWSLLGQNILQNNRSNAISLRNISFVSSTTLTAEHPYVVDGLTVQPGVTVTVDPGTELKMTTNSGIIVDGTFEVGGVGGQPVIIHGLNGAAWNRIVFNNSTSRIQNTTISGGNHGALTSQKGGMILSNNSELTFEDVSFSTSKMSGNLIEGYGSTIAVRDSVLRFDELQTDPSHKTAGIYVEGGMVTVENTTFQNMVYGVMAKLGAVVSFLRMGIEHFINTIASWWPLELFTFEPEPVVEEVVEELPEPVEVLEVNKELIEETPVIVEEIAEEVVVPEENESLDENDTGEEVFKISEGI